MPRASKSLLRRPAAVVRAALDGGVLDVAGRADLPAVGGLAHEQPGLRKRAFRRGEVAAVARAAVDVAIVVERKLDLTAMFRNRHVGRRRHAEAMAVVVTILPHGARVHDETVVAGEAHGFAAGDVLLAGRQFGEFLDRHYRVGAPALEVTDLHRVAGRTVEQVAALPLGARRIA